MKGESLCALPPVSVSALAHATFLELGTYDKSRRFACLSTMIDVAKYTSRHHLRLVASSDTPQILAISIYLDREPDAPSNDLPKSGGAGKSPRLGQFRGILIRRAQI